MAWYLDENGKITEVIPKHICFSAKELEYNMGKGYTAIQLLSNDIILYQDIGGKKNELASILAHKTICGDCLLAEGEELE